MDELGAVMLLILATWLGFAAVCLGLGFGALCMLGPMACDAVTLRRSAWLGVTITIAFLQLWHLVIPVGTVAAVALGALALPGVVWLAFACKQAIAASSAASKQPSHRMTIALVIAFALGCLWLANLSAGSGALYDTGLYHLQAVRWNHEHAIVPGLGNLHSRFAFNNSGFLVAAMFEGVGWHGRSSHVFNGFLAAVLLGHLVSLLAGMKREDTASRAVGVFALVLLPGLIILALRPLEIASLSTDFTAAVVTAGGVALLAEAMWSRLGDESHGSALVAIVGVFSAAATIKLSNAVLAAGAVLVALAVLSPKAWFAPWRGRLCAALLAAMTLTVGVWSARGVVLSGYPLYPADALAAPVSWRLAPDVLTEERNRTYNYSRGPADAYESWLGVPSSFRNLPTREVTVPLLIFVAGSIVRGLLQRHASARHGYVRQFLARTMWVFMPVMLAIIFWLTTAPAPRFAFLLVWLMAAISMASTTVVVEAAFTPSDGDEGEGEASDSNEGSDDDIASPTLKPGAMPRAARWTIGIVLLAIAIAALAVMAPPPIHWLNYVVPASPTPAVDEATLPSGLKLWVPRGTDQCWDAPLPCTPSVSARLRLRREGDIASGFESSR